MRFGVEMKVDVLNVAAMKDLNLTTLYLGQKEEQTPQETFNCYVNRVTEAKVLEYRIKLFAKVQWSSYNLN